MPSISSSRGRLVFWASPLWPLGAGWRHLDVDYEKGEAGDKLVFKIACDGPMVWFAYCW